MKVEDFIGELVRYDEFGGGYIWGTDKKGGDQMIGEIRGWGAIQNLPHLKNKPIKEAEDFQDELGRWVADAINLKLALKRQSLTVEVDGEKVIIRGRGCTKATITKIEVQNSARTVLARVEVNDNGIICLKDDAGSEIISIEKE